MKKKKPPIVLASSLVVLVGAAIVLFPKEQNPNEPPPRSAENTVPTGASRPTPSKEQLSRDLERSKQGGPKTAAAEQAGPKATLANAKTATIFIPHSTMAKQTPNDAAVQAQWYRNNARAGKKEGFK